MDHLLTIRLEAHHPERNHHRFYELAIGRDLFGLWMLVIRFGRVGQSGRQRHFSSLDPATLRQWIQQTLHVRTSAPQRLGCRYRLVHIESSVETPVQNWVSEEWLQPFR